jgi:phosphoenolpyruvate carboxykinase (ATP)
MEAALRGAEGRLGRGGTLLVETGRYTGRSPKDKHVVRRPGTEREVWWDGNAAMEPQAFERLRADMLAHARGLPLQVQDLWAGADPALRLNVRAVTERAWHALFLRHLLRRPPASALASFAPDWTILNLPSFQADPARHGSRSSTVIALEWETRTVLIGGTDYAGENKKAVFTVLNWLLPAQGVLPMHCSANHAPRRPRRRRDLLRPLGTGKTTLSSDPPRVLWRRRARLVRPRPLQHRGGLLRQDPEPLRPGRARHPRHHRHVRHRHREHGLRPHSRALDFADASPHPEHPLRLPARSHPERQRPPAWRATRATSSCSPATPSACCPPSRAFARAGDGALPCGLHRQGRGHRARRDRARAHLLALLRRPLLAPPARGLRRAPQAEDRPPRRQCWLVNTGWTGGAYGTGTRMPIAATRALLDAALSGRLAGAEFRRDPHFGFDVPVAVDGVDPSLLDPRGTWADPAAYDAQAQKLVGMFRANFARFDGVADPETQAAALG